MITSPHNPKVKLARALLTQAKARRQEQRIVLEGVRLIQDVFDQGYRPDYVLHRPDFADDLLRDLHAADIACLPLEQRIFDDLSDTEQSQGVLAVLPMPQIHLPPTATLLLGVDGLRDAGNLGTILRTAAAAGVDGVIVLPETVDPFNPKALRSGMGAHFRLPILSLDWPSFGKDFASGWTIWGADVPRSDGRVYWEDHWGRQKIILLVGSEAHGLSAQARQHAHGFVHIPMASGVESLNSAAAAAVLLFEIRRQRMQ